MVRGLAAAGCALVLAACASSTQPPVTMQTPSNSAAESPAATLRVQLDVLLGEHVFAVAKLAVSAAAGRQVEYHSYAAMLAANGEDLDTLFRAALGETSGARIGAAWKEQNNFLVDYLVAAVTQDQGSAASALSKLTGTAVPDIAAALGSAVTLAADDATKLAGGHIVLLKAIIDDAASGNYAAMYTSIVGARAQAVTFGDAVALQVARQYPDRFPGDAAAPDAARRVSLSSLLQQESYLITMATDATSAAADASTSAAKAALESSSNELATLYGGDLWLNESELIVAYAKSGGAAARESVVGAAPGGLLPAFTALLQVVDDQRNKRFGDVATDDRAMAAAFGAVADEVSVSQPS